MDTVIGNFSKILRTLLLLLEITSPFSDEECDGGDECDDADEGSEVAGGGRLVEDADLLALVVVVVPPVRRYRAEHEDGEHLQSANLSSCVSSTSHKRFPSDSTRTPGAR